MSRHHPARSLLIITDKDRTPFPSERTPASLSAWLHGLHGQTVMSQTMMGWEKTDVLAMSSWKCYKQSRRLFGHKAFLRLLKARRLSRRPRRRNLAKAIDRASDFRGRVGMLGMELQPQGWEMGHLVPKPQTQQTLGRMRAIRCNWSKPVHREGAGSSTLGGNVRKAFCMSGAGLEGKLAVAENVLFFEPFPLTTWKG